MAKEKKEKKEKKDKKEKKPKVKDDTPPLPKGPVALVCVLAVSIFVLVFFGTDLIHYSSSLSKAKSIIALIYPNLSPISYLSPSKL